MSNGWPHGRLHGRLNGRSFFNLPGLRLFRHRVFPIWLRVLIGRVLRVTFRHGWMLQSHHSALCRTCHSSKFLQTADWALNWSETFRNKLSSQGPRGLELFSSDYFVLIQSSLRQRFPNRAPILMSIKEFDTTMISRASGLLSFASFTMGWIATSIISIDKPWW